MLVALAPLLARGAERPTANVRYTRGAGAERCPDNEALRNAVAARLGRDPWDQASPRTIIVAVASAGAGLRARVELRSSDGRITGLRELTSVGRDCVELSAAVELAISLAIEPLSFASAAPADSADAPEQSSPAAPAGVAAPARVAARGDRTRSDRTRGALADRQAVARPAAEPSTRMRVDVSLGGLAALGSAPGVAGGVALQARLRWERLSVALEGRLDLPAYQEIPGGRVSSSLIMAGGLGCLHVRSLFGCGLFFVGALRGEGHEIARPERITLPYAAAGARLGVELPLVSILSLRVSADLLATLTRITLRETGGPAEYWSTPPLSGALGAAAVGTFR